VSGTVGLMYSVPCADFINACKSDPAGMALVVKDSLLGAVDPVAALAGITVTGGRLNLYKAVRSIQNYCSATGVPELGNDPSFGISNVYPNPASQEVTVVINSYESADVIISDVLGRELKRLHTVSAAGKQLVKADISDLGKGIYFVSLRNDAKRSAVVKVIVY